MTRTLALALAATLLAPLPALAQSQLDRMEAVSERANVLLNEALVAQYPALAGNLPAPEWDDEVRGAYACVLDGFVAASGEAAVDDMLDQAEAAMEGATAETLMSGAMDNMVQPPAGMTDQQAQALMGSCGVVEIMMTRMAESGAMSIMMQQ
ncbi:hypothetical protein [Roseicyclus persicicus]|uniref:hypothetical protein n=1 Tax=Roseicyclus persicicus TaxID=2650661 RepID=UPI001EF0A671|nr:hypothetical protein [Roseibacterium persicicum]